MARVAAEAGVSPATVSRVMSGSAQVSDTTRRQVYAAVSRLGYLRRGERPGDSRHPPIISAVICEPSTRMFNDPFFMRFISGAETYLLGRGVPLPLIPAARPVLASTEKHLLGGGSDGVLLVSVHGRHPLALTLAGTRLPIRAAGRPVDDVPMPFVDVDNRGGARAAVELLLKTRKRIALIAGPADLPAARDRLAGYLDALAGAGRAPLVVSGDFTPMGGKNAMRLLLDQAPNLDAVFAASDLMAMGAMMALRQAGRRIPSDVAMIGFDDVTAAAFTDPPLTTVRQPVERLGARAAELLFEQVLSGGRPAADEILDTELVIRSST
ncbi:LacI family DNA-binding transcriptional regulator [Kineosporia succinea]|uniref:DNA-binding LacI/PurR family transcriptional regulator n=1 Tax=Kineosporia succinea TaxID=84632 RepID=A0ABT9PBZ0_9ACTN|nr:LacI family DNA-binding transcriptional regulator [Kineosporia succinea]MDP9830216.1 DNA-binding LacI/PurR family transcriptional regulator [Kineosporia succinea]